MSGGACGFEDVNLPPYSGMTSCGNSPIFKDGKGCGSCYQIKCAAPQECSDQPVVVFITDGDSLMVFIWGNSVLSAEVNNLYI